MFLVEIHHPIGWPTQSLVLDQERFLKGNVNRPRGAHPVDANAIPVHGFLVSARGKGSILVPTPSQRTAFIQVCNVEARPLFRTLEFPRISILESIRFYHKGMAIRLVKTPPRQKSFGDESVDSCEDVLHVWPCYRQQLNKLAMPLAKARLH